MAMTGGGGRGTGPRAEINITPLVDVVLVLLIIFMVLTPLVLREIDVHVPRTDVEAPPDVAADQVVLRIDAAGALQLNREPIGRDALPDRLRRLFAGRAGRVLFVDVADEAGYGDAVRVMDLARGAGVATLAVMTRR